MRQDGELPRRYRFGFVLTTAAGNQTRYLNLRKYAERDAEVECVWAPISHFLDPDPYKKLPGPLGTRMVVARQARPVMKQLRMMDAVLFHAFEPYAWTALRSLVHSRPAIVWSQDNPPLGDPSAHPQSHYGSEYARPGWRARIRFAFDRWCAGRTALFLPFSTWAADVLTRECHLSPERVHPIHTGLDLEVWPYVPIQRDPCGEETRRQKILFVGGDFERKGGPLLLQAFARFAGRAELHIVTARPPAPLPEHVLVYGDLMPNDPRLRQLYADCDLFVLPTRADMSSWAALEAMATGRPVIVSGTGGIPDLIEEGMSGYLIPPDDRSALEDRMQRLLDEPDLRIQIGAAARSRVEERFNAAINVPRILNAMKHAADGCLDALAS
jgi:glycosyltransferase involved in cell wall biosynthesis